jgi:Esterase/lipase
MNKRISLEPAAIKVCNDASIPPLIFQLPPVQGRMLLEQIQNSPVYKYPAKISTLTFDTGNWGNIKVYFVMPDTNEAIRSIIYYIHGAGWVFGSFHTHEKLVRELAFRTNSLVVFPEYERSPEAQYPIAIEQCYSLLETLPYITKHYFPTIDMNTLTIAGDSVGGNMATIMTLMTKERSGIYINKQLLYYPVTNACFDTESYFKFAENYYLYREGMMWFWEQYTPFLSMRNEIYASPLRASLEELQNLPPTMIINGEADVLRDEGELYARHLRETGNDITAIRIQGIIHDFVMLNSLDLTNGCRTAMNVSISWINQRNMTILGQEYK